ncbi:hypothetical protein SAMN05216410_0841 [Sanguibacter gelidistatuariae]|uniref:Lipoprotein n=1 Tax=Sanguibacter gelidistatuariae TaxID=1814289 RepID=A0A1G6H917_9MICO|nr:hypothetical protein [Sanguibacter gelidistatuariae]SDB90711.1 hypothetical protein SAMN05216410_0841 [Sanguibacter gelidistatuariae]
MAAPALRRSRAAALLGSALVLALAAGCSSEPVTGAAFPDWDAVDARAAAHFDAQMTLLDERIAESSPFTTDARTDVTGVAYTHAIHGDNKAGGQSVVAVRGNPASVFVRQTDSKAGFTLDTLHIGGEASDYLLLGDSYSSLAPTEWVETPTIYGAPGENEFAAALRTMCFITGFQTMCEIREAIRVTQESTFGAQMRRSVQTDDDGTVHSETEVTLAAVVSVAALLDIPAGISDQFTPEMLDSFIPVSVWQDSDGNLIKMEMNGTVRGTDGVDDFVVQVGFEITGSATKKDFPAVPDPTDVTVIDESGISAFYDALGELS